MKIPCSTAVLLVVAAPAFADAMPGVRGVNHIGLTVPDLDQAEAFFTDILGCERAMAFGPFRDDQGTFMQDVLGTSPRAVIQQIRMLRCGFGSNIELFDYDAPDQTTLHQRNSDIGAYHIAFYVDDIDAAAAYLNAAGVQTNLGPIPVSEGPAAGQSILYFSAPWGLQFEAISFPGGMAYEHDGGPILWSNTAPAE
ncbi:MAG: VOC family protein [Rhodobacter sp.]|uniref:VOC family protein n=1 Tax=Pararhodobacter sp. TaxID=2127056 RepID=UPI001E01DD67|nr:VOC family protein [Pararhodobacter sp.]MCB1344368.1 VOC family protein [Paracoccaceae bacterium]MCC0074641.1 VOC family protein [Rhodobacter sp.]HPD92922.1 VOC family protein [Pararhodobacter sp.]